MKNFLNVYSCFGIVFLVCVSVFAQTATSDSANSNSVTLFDAETPIDAIQALDGAVFHQTQKGCLIETRGAQEQKRTVFPGIAIAGEWDLEGLNAIEIVVEHRDTKGRLPLRIRLAGGTKENSTGTENAYIAVANVEKNGTHTLLIPISRKIFNTTGMRRTPWNGDAISDTLSGTKIYSVGIYIEKPLLNWKWSVRRIALRKVDWKTFGQEDKKGAKSTGDGGNTGNSVDVGTNENTKPKPFTQPTRADYYRYFDPNPVWEKMTPEEFFPFIDKYGQFKYKEWPGKIHSDAELAVARQAEAEDLAEHPGPEGWDIYGGWANGPQREATGRFRVEKIEGKWWMVDPLGHLYWSHGPVRVNASSAVTPLDGRREYFEELPPENSPLAEFYHTNDAVLKDFYTVRGIQETFDFSSANARRKYGGANWREKYADLAHRRLRSWGMNTIANSSDVRIALQNRTPYCDRLTMRSPFLEGADEGFWWSFRDPFHPEFRKDIHDQLVEHRAEMMSPWCIGMFVDNELNWGQNTSLAEWALKSPNTQPAKLVFVRKLKEKYSSIENLNAAWGGNYASWESLLELKQAPPAGSAADCEEFSADTVREYFSVIHEEFQTVTPGTMYLGCRYSGVPNPKFLKIAAEYCDILSFNIYRFTLDDFKLPEGVDKPALISEFHFGALDRGMLHWTLIGVENQDARAQAYYNYVESALKHPNFVGVHWHQYAEQATTGRFDGENYQNGLVDVCDTPYVETIAKIREIGYQMYSVRFSKQ